MDTISHGLAGSMLTRAFAERPGARAAFVLGLLAGMLPDIDFIFFSDRLQYLRDHRGWTHSFLLMPFLALLLALAARLLFRQARLRTLWLFAAIGIVTHILFDWITSFGTMFWTPLSRTRYSLDWVFILDPIFTGIAFTSVFAALLFRAKGRLVAAAGSSLLILYIGFCGALHARALETWKRIDRPTPGAKVAVLPQFLSPFRWLGLSEGREEIHVAFFDIGPFARGTGDPLPPRRWSEVLQSLSDYYPPPEGARIQRFAKPSDSPVLEAARALPDVGIYRAFARFPLETVYPQGDGGATVIVQDLRFLPWFTGPWGPGVNGAFRRQPFVYRVRFDGALRAIERGFVPGGRLR
ncbi:MAG TPA: metal-dependent hydrolase [Thermoanaerobaculia bacterium]|jgi:inner membrane protein